MPFGAGHTHGVLKMNVQKIGLIIVFLVSATSNAYAYIDPGTGSVVTTAIIGFFAAAAYTCRKYFYKAVDLFKPRAKGDKSN